jgi:alkylation response protein AidB-like acyl-CoA dehydrogenase
MIQGHLVEMLSNLTAMQTMVFRLSEMQDEGILKDEHASLAKVFCTLRTRDIVSRAREVMGETESCLNTMLQDLLQMPKPFIPMKEQKKSTRSS